MNIQSYPLARAAAVALSGKTASERKMSALSGASHTALTLLRQGKGKLAKVANERCQPEDSARAAIEIALGDYQSFAVTYAARTGNDVRFGLKGDDGKWVRKPAADFRKYGAVIEHAMLQLECKNKTHTAKGEFTTAYGDLQDLISLHSRAVELMDARDAADAERRAKQAEDDRLTLLALESKLDEDDRLTLLALESKLNEAIEFAIERDAVVV